VSGCGCEEIGPMLVGPGTSGRTWHCGSCGRDWTPADVQRPQLRRVLVVDLDSRAGPFVDDLVADVRRDGTVLLSVAVSGRQLCLDARVADAAVDAPEIVDGSAPSFAEDAALVQHAIDILAMIGSGELADAVRRLAKRARR
jgi:hypothetical protein